jgi:lysophospholipase L1-like esterase
MVFPWLSLVCVLTLPACAKRAMADQQAPSSVVPQPNAEDWAIERRELLLLRARTAPQARVVLVGDSITEGFEDRGRESWQRDLVPLGALNLGCTGDRTEHVLWRLQQAPIDRLQPEHVVLLLGTNNLGHGTSTPAETVAGLQAVIAVLRQQCPAAVLHVFEVLPRNEPGSALRRQVATVNAGLRGCLHAANLQAWMAGRPRLRLHAFGSQLPAADGSLATEVMPDGLHLSAASYDRWARYLVEALTAVEPTARPR